MSITDKVTSCSSFISASSGPHMESPSSSLQAHPFALPQALVATVANTRALALAFAVYYREGSRSPRGQLHLPSPFWVASS